MLAIIVTQCVVVKNLISKRGRPFTDPEELFRAKLEDLKLKYGECSSLVNIAAAHVK